MSHSLRPRAEVPAEYIAAATAAAEALLSSSVVATPPSDDTPAWKFSGRWFASNPLSSQRRPRG